MKAPQPSIDAARAVLPELDVDAPGDANRGSRRRVLALLAFGILLTLAFFGPLGSLIAYAVRESLHSHILLVPFISGYLIYLQRRTLSRSFRCSPGMALLFAALGLGALGLAFRFRPVLSEGDYLPLMGFSFISLLIAGGFLFLGRRWMAAVAFPVAFLYFFVPLPDLVVERLETMLKLGSAEAASLLFNISGMPVFRDGLFFQLPGITLEVAQECSGIRSSWVLFMTSLVAAFLLLQSSWRRAALIAFVIPLAILRNGFRILVIGWLCVQIGPHMIHSVIHKSGGPLFFALSLLPLFLLLWWLRKGEAPKPVEK